MGIFEDMMAFGNASFGAVPQSKTTKLTPREEANTENARRARRGLPPIAEPKSDIKTPDFFFNSIKQEEAKRAKESADKEARIQRDLGPGKHLGTFPTNIPKPKGIFFAEGEAPLKPGERKGTKFTGSGFFIGGAPDIGGHKSKRRFQGFKTPTVEQQTEIIGFQDQWLQDRRADRTKMLEKARKSPGIKGELLRVETLTDILPIFSSIIDIVDITELRKAGKVFEEFEAPIRENYPSTKSFLNARDEWNIHVNTLEDYLAEIERKAGQKLSGKATAAIKDVIPFIGEIVMTGGVFSAGKAATQKGLVKGIGKIAKKEISEEIFKKSVKQAFKEGLEKGGVGTGLKAFGKQALIQAPGAAGGSLTRTVFMPWRTAVSALEKSTSINDKGEIVAESPKVFKGFLDTYIENLSEVSGEAIMTLPSALIGGTIGKALGAGLRKTPVLGKAMGKVDDFFTNWKLKNPNATVNKFVGDLKEAGVNNIFEEFGEERFGGFLRGLTNVNDSDKGILQRTYEASIPQSFDELIIELAALTVPGGVSVGAGAVNQAFKKRPTQDLNLPEDISAENINKLQRVITKDWSDLGVDVKTRYNKKENKLETTVKGMTKDAIADLNKRAKDKGITVKELINGVKKDIAEEPVVEEARKEVLEGFKQPKFGEAITIGEGVKDPVDSSNKIHNAIRNLDVVKDKIKVNLPEAPIAKEEFDENSNPGIIKGTNTLIKEITETDVNEEKTDIIDKLNKDNSMMMDTSELVNEIPNVEFTSTVKETMENAIIQALPEVDKTDQQEMDRRIDLFMHQIKQGAEGDALLSYFQKIYNDYNQTFTTEDMTEEQKDEAILNATLQDVSDSAFRKVNETVLENTKKDMVDAVEQTRGSVSEGVQAEIDALTKEMIGATNVDFIETFIEDYKALLEKGAVEIAQQITAPSPEQEITDAKKKQIDRIKQGFTELENIESQIGIIPDGVIKTGIADFAHTIQDILPKNIQTELFKINEDLMSMGHTDATFKNLIQKYKDLLDKTVVEIRNVDFDEAQDLNKLVEGIQGESVSDDKVIEGPEDIPDSEGKMFTDIEEFLTEMGLQDAGGEGIPPTKPPTAEGQAEPDPEDARKKAEEIARLKNLNIDEFDNKYPTDVFNPDPDLDSNLSEGTEKEIIERLHDDALLIDDYGEFNQIAEQIAQDLRNLYNGPLIWFKGKQQTLMGDILSNARDVAESQELIMNVWTDANNQTDFVNQDTTVGDMLQRYDSDPAFRVQMDNIVEHLRLPYTFDSFVDQVMIDSNHEITDDFTVKQLYDFAFTKSKSAIGNARAIAIVNNIGKNIGATDIQSIFKKNFIDSKGNIIKDTANIINKQYSKLLKEAKGNTAVADMAISPTIREGINALDRIADNFPNELNPELLSIEQIKLIEDNKLLFDAALGNAIRNVSEDLTMTIGNKTYNISEINDAKNKIFDAPKDGGIIPNKKLLDPLGIRKKLSDKTKGVFGAKNIKPEYIARMLTGYQFDNPIYQILGTGIQDGLNTSARFEMEVYSALREGLKDINLAKMSSIFGISVGPFNDKRTKIAQLGGKNIKLTPMELLDIYMTLRQEDGRRHVVNKRQKNGKLSVKDGFVIKKSQFDKAGLDDIPNLETRETFTTGGLSEAEVIGVRNQVEGDEELMKVGNLFIELQEPITNTINRTSRDVIGTNIATVADYWHLEPIIEGRDIGRGIKTNNLNSIEGRGAFKERVKSVKPLMVRDALHRFVSQIKGNADYVGMAKPQRQIATIINDEKFRSKLIERGYAQELDAYTEILHNATNVVKQSDAAAIVQGANSIAATGILALNIPVVILQNMSSMLYPTVMDNSAYLSKFGIAEQTVASGKNLLQFGGSLLGPNEWGKMIGLNYNEAMEHSPIFWLRATEGNINPELTPSTERTIRSQVPGKRGIAKKVLDTGTINIKNLLTTPIKKSDMIALLNGWQLSKREVARFADKGMDGLSNPSAIDWYTAYTSMGKIVPTPADVAEKSEVYWNMVNARSQYVWASTQPSFNAFERTANNSEKHPWKSFLFAFRSYWDTVNSVVNDTFKRTGYDSNKYGAMRATYNFLRSGASIYFGLAMASLLKDMTSNLIGRREKDPDEIIFNMALPFFNIIPLIGPMAQQLLKPLVTNKVIAPLIIEKTGELDAKKISPFTFKMGLPAADYILRILQDTTEDIIKIDGGNLTDEEKIEIAMKMGNSATKLGGVNLSDAIKIYGKATEGRGRSKGRRRRTSRRRAPVKRRRAPRRRR